MANISVPNTFVNNTQIADATQVNGNFGAIVSGLAAGAYDSYWANLNINSSLVASGIAQFYSSVSFAGTATFSAAVVYGGSVTQNGAVNFASSVSFADSSTFNDFLYSNHNAQFASSVTFSTASTYSGVMNAQAGIVITGGSTANGAIWFASNTLKIRGGTSGLALNNTSDVSVFTMSDAGQIDILNGSIALIVGADSAANTRTNATNKFARIGCAHYTNSEEPVAIASVFPTSSTNLLYFGGGTSSLNAATEIRLYTAANNTTTTGTARLTIDTNGLSTFTGDVYISAASTTSSGPTLRLNSTDTNIALDEIVGQVQFVTNDTSTAQGEAYSIKGISRGTTGTADLVFYRGSPAGTITEVIRFYGGADNDAALFGGDVTINGTGKIGNTNALSSADYVVTDTDGYAVINVTTGGSTRTVTLPTAADNDEREIIIRKVDTGSGAVTVAGEGAETIDGSATQTINTQYMYYHLRCNGTGWNIQARGQETFATSSPTIANAGTSPSGSIEVVRFGDVVTISASITTGSSGSPTDSPSFTAVLPTWARPAHDAYSVPVELNTGTENMWFFNPEADGDVFFRKRLFQNAADTIATANFTTSETRRATITYVV